MSSLKTPAWENNISVSDLSKMYEVSPTTIRKWIELDIIKAYKNELGNWIVYDSEQEAFEKTLLDNVIAIEPRIVARAVDITDLWCEYCYKPPTPSYPVTKSKQQKQKPTILKNRNDLDIIII